MDTPNNRRHLVVVVNGRFHDYAIERGVLATVNAELREAECATEREIADACRDADAVLVNLATVGETALDGMMRCRVISRYGVGLDNIDLAAAARHGIPVRNVPNYCDDEVAEHALGLLLDAARSISFRDRRMRSGDWNIKAFSRRVAGSRLCVLGFGGIGRAFARRAVALGLSQLRVHSQNISEARLADALGPEALALAASLGTAVRAVPVLDDALRDADFCSIHLRLDASTRGLVGARELSLLAPGAILINVARGPIVDEAALTAALQSGHLGGAGLDVFSAEPPPADSALRHLESTVLTDHAAFYSRESVLALKRRAAENIAEVLATQ